jgi:hypothetical protein
VVLDEGAPNLKGGHLYYCSFRVLIWPPLLSNDVQVLFLLGGWPIEATNLLLIMHFYNRPTV